MQFKFIELVPPGTKIDFIKYRRIAITISLIINLIVLCGVVIWPGLNYGVDFAGGTSMEVKFKKPVGAGEIRELVHGLGFSPVVQVYGNPADHAFLIRVERMVSISKEEAARSRAAIQSAFAKEKLDQFGFDPRAGDKLVLQFQQSIDTRQLQAVLEKAGVHVKEVDAFTHRDGEDHEYDVLAIGPGDRIGDALRAKLGAKNVDVQKVDYVGPEVGKQLRNQGILSVIYAIGMILLYVGFRFDFRFSPGVVIALIHDAVVTLGYFVVTQREFNLTSVTVILTVVGYSVNDTIVVYDRIRENSHKLRGKPLRDIINISINEMLGRTILTSGATALSLVGLLIYGVGTIFDFSAAMTLGIISGTYSTWYIASPMTIWLDEVRKQRAQQGKRSPMAGKQKKGAEMAAR